MSIPPIHANTTQPVLPIEPLKNERQPFSALDQKEKQEQSLSTEKREKKLQEASTRYLFDQMTVSIRRHTQDMQKQIQEQQREEEERNNR